MQIRRKPNLRKRRAAIRQSIPRLGRRKTWQIMEQQESFDKDPALAAEIYTQLGEKEKALEWLEIAYEKRAGALATLNTKPTWDSLRKESRFQKILSKMNAWVANVQTYKNKHTHLHPS